MCRGEYEVLRTDLLASSTVGTSPYAEEGARMHWRISVTVMRLPQKGGGRILGPAELPRTQDRA